ncbi:DivIVA domain-containing protein [Aestuariimicrobium soli]|uniref:DivIVA domain-containing protein n=1 Tax=Aestuariimicrobium soli TaxID=2035834 RepID=UPI003EBB3AB9
MLSPDDVRSVTFPTSRRAHEGYSEQAVDEFVELVAQRMERGESPAGLLAGARFPMARRDGYRAQEVDDFIDRLIEQYPLARGQHVETADGRRQGFWSRLFG